MVTGSNRAQVVVGGEEMGEEEREERGESGGGGGRSGGEKGEERGGGGEKEKRGGKEVGREEGGENGGGGEREGKRWERREGLLGRLGGGRVPCWEAGAALRVLGYCLQERTEAMCPAQRLGGLGLGPLLAGSKDVGC